MLEIRAHMKSQHLLREESKNEENLQTCGFSEGLQDTVWNLIQMVMTAYLAPSTGLNIIIKITFVTKIEHVLFKLPRMFEYHYSSKHQIITVVSKTFSRMPRVINL